jgi:hypothetical protein
MRALLVVKWQVAMKGVEVNLLLWYPSQWHDTRGHPFHDGRGVWCKT